MNETALDASKGHMTLYYDAAKAGGRPPYNKFVRRFLRKRKVCPVSLHPNAWMGLMAYVAFCRHAKLRPSYRIFSNITSFQRSSRDWLSLNNRRSYRAHDDYPKRIGDWQYKFFFLDIGFFNMGEVPTSRQALDNLDLDACSDLKESENVIVNLFKNTTEPPMPFADGNALRNESCLRFNELVIIPYLTPITVEELNKMGIMNLSNMLNVSSRNDVAVAATKQRVLVEAKENSDFETEEQYDFEQMLKQEPTGRLANRRMEELNKETSSSSSRSRESSPLPSPKAPKKALGKGKKKFAISCVVFIFIRDRVEIDSDNDNTNNKDEDMMPISTLARKVSTPVRSKYDTSMNIDIEGSSSKETNETIPNASSIRSRRPGEGVAPHVQSARGQKRSAEEADLSARDDVIPAASHNDEFVQALEASIPVESILSPIEENVELEETDVYATTDLGIKQALTGLSDNSLAGQRRQTTRTLSPSCIDRVSHRLPLSIVISDSPSFLPPYENAKVDITGSTISTKAKGKKTLIESSKDEAESDSRPSIFEIVVK